MSVKKGALSEVLDETVGVERTYKSLTQEADRCNMLARVAARAAAQARSKASREEEKEKMRRARSETGGVVRRLRCAG